ncbi:hypothetical protein CRENBAI_003614 [Crenichthys baileyi]|uniref:Uncharacterized protein n=1 Tax=Crenichthys baileyi TaxID=28760 RepID=A0AAV9S1P6_9TELE
MKSYTETISCFPFRSNIPSSFHCFSAASPPLSYCLRKEYISFNSSLFVCVVHVGCVEEMLMPFSSLMSKFRVPPPSRLSEAGSDCRPLRKKTRCELKSRTNCVKLGCAQLRITCLLLIRHEKQEDL